MAQLKVSIGKVSDKGHISEPGVNEMLNLCMVPLCNYLILLKTVGTINIVEDGWYGNLGRFKFMFGSKIWLLIGQSIVERHATLKMAWIESFCDIYDTIAVARKKLKGCKFTTSLPFPYYTLLIFSLGMFTILTVDFSHFCIYKIFRCKVYENTHESRGI